MKLFALQGSEEFGRQVANHLQLSLGKHEEREFEDGEHKIRPLENIRNQDTFILHSLYSDARQTVNDKLCRLLFFISALKDSAAKSVTAVIPYFCYARKDRRTKPGDPVTSRYVARLLEASGADNVVTMDIHNLQAFQNAFSIPAENLKAKKLFASFLAGRISDRDVAVVSPDFGGAKRAEEFFETLEKMLPKPPAFAVMEKYRSSGTVWGSRLAGDVHGRLVIILDDLISTGGTVVRAAAACRSSGASSVIAMATHGLFTGRAAETLKDPVLDQLVITNTVPPFRLASTDVKSKLTIVDAAPLFAEAIRRINEGGSIDELLENDQTHDA
ncbi:ribose-phosphate diphosphokinase [Flavisolibacter nicotianae]|uniref:ribose-phosphate diphosphokinase n=1 Tax=Flavisolibacter nicotianae TaxID=2364882 RepID=UPI000EB17F46|nr:ribose-phosphate pyrophosphokinase [Flavisolibacter nicotianae]